MDFTAREIAEYLKGDIEGNADVKVGGFARIESGKKGTLSFFANPKYEKSPKDTFLPIFVEKKRLTNHPLCLRYRRFFADT